MRFSTAALSVLCALAICGVCAIPQASANRSGNSAAEVRERKPSSRTGPRREGSGEGRRIIGGVPEPVEFPFVVRTTRIGGVSGLLCSGTLINSKWIVTAAHCFLNDMNDGYRTIEDGITEFLIGCAAGTADDSCISAVAKKIVPHPCYTPSQFEDHDDIAMVELTEELDWKAEDYALVDNIDGTALLNTPGDLVSLAGYGVESNSAETGSAVLMRVDVETASKQTCEEANPTDVFQEWVDYDNAFCSGGEEGKDSCSGDSGGPAIKKSGGKWWLVGVSVKGSQNPQSNGNCGIEGRYGVYSRVEKYAEFIKKTISDEVFTCTCSSCVVERGYWRQFAPDATATTPAPSSSNTVSGAGGVRASAAVWGLGALAALVFCRNV